MVRLILAVLAFMTVFSAMVQAAPAASTTAVAATPSTTSTVAPSTTSVVATSTLAPSTSNTTSVAAVPTTGFTGVVGSIIENTNTMNTSVVSTGALYSDNPNIGITQTINYSNITYSYTGPNLVSIASASGYPGSSGASRSVILGGRGSEGGLGNRLVSWLPVMVVVVTTVMMVGGSTVLGRVSL